MGRRLRYFPDRPLVEVTARTIQGRFLLKLTAGFPEVLVGILARAQARYDVDIHAYVALSNHLHILLSPRDAHQLAAFMRYVLTNLSKEAGRRHRWRGPLFVRRYQAIWVSEENEAQIGRLRYLLAHGVKEGLVVKVAEWPGAHCARALISGEAPVGVWLDRTREHAAKHRGEDTTEADFKNLHTLELAPLPCWRNLLPEMVRGYIAEIVAEVEAAAAARHQEQRTAPLGIAGILQQDPHDRPKKSSWSPAPLVHAATKKIRHELRTAFYEFVAAFRVAAEQLKLGCRDVAFPDGSFPPSLPFCRGA